jgi:hypothetical protein
MSVPTSDYDHPWKDALEEYMPDFLALFFPDIYADIDWSVPPVFLDSELQQIARDAETGVVRVDKLVRLTLLEGRRIGYRCISKSKLRKMAPLHNGWTPITSASATGMIAMW